MIPIEKIENQSINKEIIPTLNLININPLEMEILFDRYKQNIYSERVKKIK